MYKIVEDYIPKQVVSNKNRNNSWIYGYNEQYDVVVISKSGQIGDVINISGLLIALPLTPTKCLQRHTSNSEQYWERQELPKTLSKIQSIFQWNEMPSEFKNMWVDYIEQEFDYRESKVFGL